LNISADNLSNTSHLGHPMSTELNPITKEAWNTAANTEDKREKIQALSLAKECYSMKLDLLTNATVVDDAIRFVSQKSKEKARSLGDSNEDEKEQLKEPDYDEDEDPLRGTAGREDWRDNIDNNKSSFLKSLYMKSTWHWNSNPQPLSIVMLMVIMTNIFG
jgi:hypothetical protein